MELTLPQKAALDAFCKIHGPVNAILSMASTIRLCEYARADLLKLAETPRPLMDHVHHSLLNRGWVTKTKVYPVYGYEATHHVLTESGLRAAHSILFLMKHEVVRMDVPNNVGVEWTNLAMRYLGVEPPLMEDWS